MVSSLLALLFTLCILLSIANEAAVGRSVPLVSKEVTDTKQPDWLVEPHDGGVLIPGFGHVLLPPSHGHKGHHHHDLLHYNPITGTYSGTGHIPIGSRIRDWTPRTYVPGGDNTLVPNPGVEVPILGRGPRAPVAGNPPWFCWQANLKKFA